MFEIKDNNDVDFTQRPNPIPYNYRLSYKVSQICLILKLSVARGGVSMTKIQMLASALLSDKEAERLVDLTNGFSWNYLVRYDPTVIRALKYGLFDGLIIQQDNEKYRLSDKGKEFVRKIQNDKTLMIREKEFLNTYSQKLTENVINMLMVQWRYDDVNNK
ncbi:hypothetical protein FDF97_03380 [Clostridium botulinum]|uniref:Uncharacterized protein n=1 Tax=Clostridium botulinum TaxID=1491 RepID=A0AA43Y4G3_CLOBO|nr:hypothetical protein [Clostridium botulinum]NFI20119.1 hypothetical protein [Clostridium botulinum]NFQ77298.1 hypothetical protein [Clostridium botulinum]